MTAVLPGEITDKTRKRASAKARELRTYYEEFLAAGFTPEQAWELVTGGDWLDEIFK